ncbi:hypothetical protein QEN19_002999 [Hanseniaspora menglaensis]
MGIFDFSKSIDAKVNNAVEDVDSLNEESINDNDMFLFDSDDESVPNKDKTLRKRRRDDSLLTKIRYRFGKNIDEGLEDDLKNINVLDLPSTSDSKALTQPTQLNIFSKDANLTQPTQLKVGLPDAADTQPTQLKNIEENIITTQVTQLKDVFYSENPSEVSIQMEINNTQPTQIKSMVTQATQLKPGLEEYEEEEEDLVVLSKKRITQPTQLNINDDDDFNKSFSSSQKYEASAKLKPIFDSDDSEEDEDRMISTNIKNYSQTKEVILNNRDEHSLLSLNEQLPIIQDSVISGFESEEDVIKTGNDLYSSTQTKNHAYEILSDDSYNSDISDYEIDLKPIEESLTINHAAKIKKNILSPTILKPSTESIFISETIMLKPNDVKKDTITFSSDEDSDRDVMAEKGTTKATTLVIKAHLAQKKFKNNVLNKKNPNSRNGMLDTNSLVEKLRKEAARQSNGAKVDLAAVDKLYDEIILNKNLNDESDAEVSHSFQKIENEKLVDDSDFPSDEIREEDSQKEKSDAFVEEIGYGKKMEKLDASDIEVNNVSRSSFDSDSEKLEKTNDHNNESKISNYKQRLRKTLVEDEKDRFNPFVAEEAEESDSDDDELLPKEANKDQDDYVDNEIHTSDEEMMDDDSDLENNEERLRDLNREQQAIDEEILEQKIKKTLKGKRRGHNDEFDIDDDDFDLEEDEEYLAYKKKQNLIDDQITKRMNKSKKIKMNVMEGLNSRAILPESKIGILDKITVSSTLSFLGINPEDEIIAQEKETIQENLKKLQHENNLDTLYVNQSLDKKYSLQGKLKTFEMLNGNEGNNDDDDDDEVEYSTMSFFKKSSNFIKKKPVDNENLKFRLGTKSYSKSYSGNNNILKSENDKQNGSSIKYEKQINKKEVPFIGSKRQLQQKTSGFNRDYKRFKYSQSGFSKKG